MKRSRKYSTMIYILLYTIALQYHYVDCNSTLSPAATLESPSVSTPSLLTNQTTEIPHTTEELLQIIKSSTVRISTEASDLDEVTKHEHTSSSTTNNPGKPKDLKTPSKVEPKIDQDQISG